MEITESELSVETSTFASLLRVSCLMSMILYFRSTPASLGLSPQYGEGGFRDPLCEWHSVAVYQRNGAGQTKKIHFGLGSEQIFGIMALGGECELCGASGVDFFTDGRARRPDTNGHGFIVFAKSAACVAEIKAGTTVRVFRRIYGRELPPVVHDSLGLLGFCPGLWEDDFGLGPYPKIAVRPLEDGDRVPATAV